MSVQFGTWNFEGQAATRDYIDEVSTMLAPYGPDSNELYSHDGLTIVYRAFHTTKESRRETQPHIAASGAVVTWDGRLDNRGDLISQVPDPLTINSTDVEVVAAAYEKWGTNCLPRLIGDWALSIWDPINRCLILAQDFVGTRHLYYSFNNNQVNWCTILDPLVRFAGRTFELCEEYIAGWLANEYPAAHITPYVGIHAVPPSSAVLLSLRRDHRINSAVRKFWDFNPSRRIHYSASAEYEDHFRTVFAQAVRRRLRSDRPILAELSGGMDSSSIVCMADTVMASSAVETPRLDTISYYDDSYDSIEPDWNEQPYFRKVEQKRGATGCHINIGELRQRNLFDQRPFGFEFDGERLAATPIPNSDPSELREVYASYMRLHGHRVLLSGIGGDEATGGCVPTPTPELQDFIIRGQFCALRHRMKAWAVKMKRSQMALLWAAIHGFCRRSLTDTRTPKDPRCAFWLLPSFVRRNQVALRGYPSRVRPFGPLPSFQHNIATLDLLRRTVAAFILLPNMLCEARFPYMDRDLLEYLYAVPREQIVGVGKRRYLMKRALVGIVPNELLSRRRKRFNPQAQEYSSMKWPGLAEVGNYIAATSAGVMDTTRFLEALQTAQRHEEVVLDALKRSLLLESWLHHLARHGVIPDSTEATSHDSISFSEERGTANTFPSKGSAS